MSDAKETVEPGTPPVPDPEVSEAMAERDSLAKDRDATRDADLAELRKEIEALRADKARRDRPVRRGDADGVSPPLEDGEERENTHVLLLANGKTVEMAGAGATHVGTPDGTFRVITATELAR